MKKLIMGVFLLTIVALPAWVQGAQYRQFVTQQGSQIQDDQGEDDDDQGQKKPKSVPEPATMLLVGAAGAGLWGARRLLRSKRRQDLP